MKYITMISMAFNPGWVSGGGGGRGRVTGQALAFSGIDNIYPNFEMDRLS